MVFKMAEIKKTYHTLQTQITPDNYLTKHFKKISGKKKKKEQPPSPLITSPSPETKLVRPISGGKKRKEKLKIKISRPTEQDGSRRLTAEESGRLGVEGARRSHGGGDSDGGKFFFSFV